LAPATIRITNITAYAYDTNDRLQTETAVGAASAASSYTYDNNGNTLTKFDGTTTTSYAYDSRNRLQNLNAGQVTYQYDALGIRQSETAAGLTTHYLTDPNRDYAQVIEESFDLNAFAEVTYSYGDDLLHQHRRIDATTTNSSTYHYDGIGSTRQLTDAAGAITDSYTYTAFGETEAQTGITPNGHLCTGEQFDPNLGFYYLRARYYNPGVGRFQNMDTFPGRVFEPVTLHKYLYANVNPTNMTDPSGLFGLRDIQAGFKVIGTLIRSAIPTFRTFLQKAGKAPKWAVYKGLKTKRTKLSDADGLRFVPHFSIYVERLVTPGIGFRYDIGALDSTALLQLLKTGELSVATGGFIEKGATTRAKLALGGSRLDRKPQALLSHVEFLIWEATAYQPFADGFDYCLAGTNCASWTLMALAEAKGLARLPLAP